jgi:hypothetical protein
MKMSQMKKAIDSPSTADAVARIEPAELSRFEGEGGPEAPELGDTTPHEVSAVRGELTGRGAGGRQG